MGRSVDLAQAALDYERDHGGGHITYGTKPGQMVCNWFVEAVIRENLDPGFPNMLADDFASCGYFVKVDDPLRGDLVHFPGHIGIVTNPDAGLFIGAQTSTGVKETSYKHGYWAGDYQGKKPDYFLRWSR